MMKTNILNLLHDLRAHALTKNCHISLYYHDEESTLMRFANSAISLNTNERLIRLNITATRRRNRASYEMIVDLEQVNEMKQAIDRVVEMVTFVQPLEYDPTIPEFAESFGDEEGYDPELGEMEAGEKLSFFNHVVDGLETDDLRLSGIFSSGTNTIAQINTASEHTQYFCTSDAQVSVVLAHLKKKWEVQSENSAQKKADLNPDSLRDELAFLVARFSLEVNRQLPLGSYDIIFGPAATAELVSFMNWVGFNGGLMKRGFSFMSEEQLGKPVFSPLFSLVDDPTRIETFPFRRDLYGLRRERFPLFLEGVFSAFTWAQDDADEFGRAPTGHSVPHKSLVMSAGDYDVSSLEELVKMGGEEGRILLYIPFLHYMNLVNPSKGVVTGTSRFGTLAMDRDGTVSTPFNVRLTQSLLDIFGRKTAWMSRDTMAYNTSSSYGARNPTAVIVPRFVRVNGLEISHANQSF